MVGSRRLAISVVPSLPSPSHYAPLLVEIVAFLSRNTAILPFLGQFPYSRSRSSDLKHSESELRPKIERPTVTIPTPAATRHRANLPLAIPRYPRFAKTIIYSRGSKQESRNEYHRRFHGKFFIALKLVGFVRFVQELDTIFETITKRVDSVTFQSIDRWMERVNAPSQRRVG